MKDPLRHSADDDSQHVVWIVDDEHVVTQSISALLSLETDYEVQTAQSPTDALRSLQDTEPDLIISDFLMPEMNGLEFLTETKKMYPDVPRILLTGYADKENAIRAINEVGLFQYIEKPWDNDQLMMIIRNALSNKSLKENLATRIRELDRASFERSKLVARDELLSEELAMARRLQEGMLPSQLPNTDGIALAAKYLPALDIGGDFYDVIPLERDCLAVLIADATGHGIQAALSTAILKFAFASFSHQNVGPHKILAGMNKILYSGLPKDTFVAAMVVAIDLKTKQCRLANSGIPHPYLFDGERGDAKRVIANGFVLGIIDNEHYVLDDEVIFNLRKGDRLIMYTDGLSEVENDAGEQFDKSRMPELIGAHNKQPINDLSEILVEECRAFGIKTHTWDDIAIVGVEVK